MANQNIPPVGANNSSREVRSADGTVIAYTTIGAGPPLVVVHGSLDAGGAWIPVANMLADNFTVYVMSRRGLGRSGDVAPDEYSLQKEVEDVEAVLAAAGGEPCLLGHSYGALIALEVACRAHIKKLVLYEPPLSINGTIAGPALEPYREAVESGRLDWALAYALKQFVGMSEAEISSMQASPFWEGLVAFTPTVTRELEAIDRIPRGVVRYGQVTAPVLLLTGTATAAFFVAATNAVQALLPGATTVKIEGHGHVAHFAVPDVIATDIRRFLRSEAQ
jgi:pimeloyl-ACP methyl ester carboxylesterase